MQATIMYKNDAGMYLHRQTAEDTVYIHFCPSDGEELPFPEVGQLVPYEKIPELQAENADLYDTLADAAQSEYDTLMEELEA